MDEQESKVKTLLILIAIFWINLCTSGLCALFNYMATRDYIKENVVNRRENAAASVMKALIHEGGKAVRK